MLTAADYLAGLKDRDALDAKNYRDMQNTGIVFMLSQSRTLARLVATWPHVPLLPDPNPQEEVPPDLPESYRLRWLWARVEPDPIPAWLATAGLPDAPHTRRWCLVAQDQQMVYPDSTVSKWAQQFLTSHAADALG